MNLTLGKSIAILARSITTNEPQDKVATENPLESIDAEVTEATGVDAIEKEAEKEKEKEPVTTATNPPIEATEVDAIAHKLSANEEDPTEKEAEKG